MASLPSAPHLLLFLALMISATSAASRPHALVVPVSKDAATSQYATTIKQRTPLVPIKLVVDLGGRFLWVDCETGYSSSTYRPALCNSAHCNLAKSIACGTCNSPPAPGCNNNTCSLFPENPVISTSTIGELALDVLSLPSTDGSNPGPLATDPSFLFTCGSTFLLQNLSSRATGMLGLGRTKIGTPTQLAAAFSFPRKFALCLPSSPRANGVAFFGDGPYNLLPNTTDASQSLLYTPLLLNPVSTAGTSTEGEPSADYFIGVRSIKVNDKAVPLNKTLLAIDGKTGVGGTKISTVNPYTLLETSIYHAVTEAFAAALGSVKRAAAVAPFKLCYDAGEIGSTRVGPAVPAIDMVLHSKQVYWRIFGANSMVEVSSNVLCLGFVDGGESPRTSIVIGGHQIEDNLLQFDLAASKLGFSSSLLFRQTTCANFNFTSTARLHNVMDRYETKHHMV